MGTKQNKELLKRLKYTPFYWLIGFLIIFGAFFCGVSLSKAFSNEAPAWAIAALIVLCVIPVLLAVVQVLKTRSYEKKLSDMDAAERIRFLLAHRENAEQTAAEKYRLLGRLRRGSSGTAALLAAIGTGIPFFAGLCFVATEVLVPLELYSLALLFAALPRLDPVNRREIDSDLTSLQEADYPALYDSLRAAAKKMGFSGEIKVVISPDCSAGIIKTKRGCVVELGVLLWYVLSSEELTAIFLHEFAHLQNSYIRDGKAEAHTALQSRIDERPFFPALQRLFYPYFDTASLYEILLFRYSVSLLAENEADDLMRREGDTKTAASALLKSGYYIYYEWMNGTADSENPFQSEETLRSFVKRNAACFLSVTEANCENWNRLIETALPARSDTHPLLMDRLKKLGLSQLFKPDFTREPGVYTAECEKAIELCSELVFDGLPQPFEVMQRELYLNQKEKVEDWETEGCPLEAGSYADIDDALRRLGRMDEANELCRKAIETLPAPAAMYANFALGLYLLHDFDPAGIPLVYKAAEGNSNFTEEGFETIGSFCCMMGLSDALEEYRERSVAAAQKGIDFYSKIDDLAKKDDLCEEHLPQELQNDLTAFFAQIDEGKLQSVSVIRKTISPKYFTSPVIVRFVPGVSDETKDEMMHKIFMHLDTCSDWQFSLFNYDDVVHIGKELIDGAVIYGMNRRTKE